MAQDNDEKAGADAPKSKKGLVFGAVGGVVVLLGGAIGGAVLGPKMLGSAPEARAAAAPEPPPPAVPEVVVSSKFEPIIIDLRGKRGEMHHLKVGLAVELRDGITEQDFKVVSPRGREAALTYLRTLSFHDATNPTEYAVIQKELAERVMKAIGEDKLHRVLLVDFVAQ